MKKILITILLISLVYNNIVFAYSFKEKKTFSESEYNNSEEVEWYNEHNLPYRVKLRDKDYDTIEYEYYNCEDYKDWVQRSTKIIVKQNSNKNNNNIPSQMEIDAYKSGQFMMDFEGNLKDTEDYFKNVRKYLKEQNIETDNTKNAMNAKQIAIQQAIIKFGFTSSLANEFASYTYDLDNFLNNTYMNMTANTTEGEKQYNRQMLKTYHERLHQFLNTVIIQYDLNGNGVSMYPQIKHDVDIAIRMYRDVKNLFSFLK